MPNIIKQSTDDVNKKPDKIAFLGTPEFAVPILEKLAQSEYKPIAVFCAPDKPVGRKQILTPPPAKVTAEKYGIPVFQPEEVSSFKFQVSSLKPDLIISAAYSIILPKEVLNLPEYGCLNVHPSLLPKYRGPSPIQATILNGDQKTGMTIYKMDEKIDHGSIIKNQKINIENQKYTTPKLSQLLSQIGADLLISLLPAWFDGKIHPQPQDESQATYTKIIKKQDGRIDWQKPAQYIERQIRAFVPWPGVYTNLKTSGSKLKIIEANVSKKNTSKKTGEIFLTDDHKLTIQAGKNSLVVKKLQLEGGKPMESQEFLRGHREIIGQILS